MWKCLVLFFGPLGFRFSGLNSEKKPMIETSTIFGIRKSYRSCKSEDARVTVVVNRKLQEVSFM